jgi:hypothetical protein
MTNGSGFSTAGTCDYANRAAKSHGRSSLIRV